MKGRIGEWLIGEVVVRIFLKLSSESFFLVLFFFDKAPQASDEGEVLYAFKEIVVEEIHGNHLVTGCDEVADFSRRAEKILPSSIAHTTLEELAFGTLPTVLTIKHTQLNGSMYMIH